MKAQTILETTNLFAFLWTYDGQVWAQLNSGPSPVPRSDALMVYDDARDVLLLFGRHDASWNLPQTTWELHYESALPLQDCTNGVDDDTDGRVDCADGDCDGRPCATGTCGSGTCQ